MNKFMVTVATASLLIGSSAIAAEKQTYDAKVSIEKDEDGNYSKKITEESKDFAGTKVTSEENSEVKVDAEGDKTTTVETKTTKDPKGLFNKTTVETKDEVKTDDGQVETKYEKKVDGEKVEEQKFSHEND